MKVMGGALKQSWAGGGGGWKLRKHGQGRETDGRKRAGRGLVEVGCDGRGARRAIPVRKVEGAVKAQCLTGGGCITAPIACVDCAYVRQGQKGSIGTTPGMVRGSADPPTRAVSKGPPPLPSSQASKPLATAGATAAGIAPPSPPPPAGLRAAGLRLGLGRAELARPLSLGRSTDSFFEVLKQCCYILSIAVAKAWLN